jgi:hypothetical protein
MRALWALFPVCMILINAKKEEMTSLIKQAQAVCKASSFLILDFGIRNLRESIVLSIAFRNFLLV